MRTGIRRLSIELPEELHRRTKIWAAQHETDIRAMVIEGLETVMGAGWSKAKTGVPIRGRAYLASNKELGKKGVPR